MGKYAIGLYIGHTELGSTYGAVGAIVIIPVCVYYASQILFVGADPGIRRLSYAERGGDRRRVGAR
jgi:uncharacterized BrkB/YihY/UPF0761 family membrane protein